MKTLKMFITKQEEKGERKVLVPSAECRVASAYLEVKVDS